MRTLLIAPLVVLAASCGGLVPPSSSDVPDAGAARPRYVDYLRGDRFPKLVIEVDSVQGMAPRSTSSDAVVQTLKGVLEKPGGITVKQTDSLSSKGTDHAWTNAELDELARSTFDPTLPADTISMHVLFVDGHSAEDSSNGKILGLAWAHTHVVIFKQTIEASCRSGLSGLLAERVCEDAEQGVWTHELGHLLGLVDNGVPMIDPHADSAHPAHDSSRDCVMYWAWETGSFLDELRARVTNSSTAPLQFDAECQKDLEAVRNGKD